MGEWSDEDILLALRESATRDAALRLLWVRWYKPVRGLLRAECNDWELVDEVVPRVFLATYDYWSRVREPCRSLKPWLFKVAKNKLRDAIRSRDDDWEQVLSLDDPDREELAVGDGLTFEGAATVDVLDEAVGDVLEQLRHDDPRAHLLLEMEYKIQSSRDEMSEATKLPKREIPAYLKRAREKFVRLSRQHPVLSRFAPEANEPVKRA